MIAQEFLVISLFFHRPTFNRFPFKRFCLPFKSSFRDVSTCFCGLCVHKRIIADVRLRERERQFLAGNSCLPITLDPTEHKSKWKPILSCEPCEVSKPEDRERRVKEFSVRLIDLIWAENQKFGEFSKHLHNNRFSLSMRWKDEARYSRETVGECNFYHFLPFYQKKFLVRSFKSFLLFSTVIIDFWQ